jgi:sulfite reductase alpha subunit-like flavoprotein
LKQLGANLVLDLCLGDDQHDYGYWGAVDPFLSQLWDCLNQRFNLPQFMFAADYLPPSTFSITSPPNVTEGDGHISNGCTSLSVEVKSNERVTPVDHFQETRLIRLQNPDLKYNPGDVVAILPQNSPDDVKDLLQLMKLNGDEEVTVSVRSGSSDCPALFSFSHLPGTYKLEQLIQSRFDLHAVPKRSFFSLLWKFSRDETEKEKLKEFSTIAGQADLYEYCFKPKRMIIEVLRDFPNTTAQIPLQYLPDLLPAIKHREFSIASSSKANPGELQILVVVVEFKTRLKQMRTGFCSNFLSKCQPGDMINASIQKGSFQLPSSKPLIMIGPGSGVAPFRGIIEDRVLDGIRDNVLFFGCRNKLADFYFERDWQRFVVVKSLNLFTAFSRDQVQKIYVQHKMREQKDLILEWINQKDAVILVAGSSNQMPTAVREELVLIVRDLVGDGEAFVTRMESSKRLQYECWD